MPRQAGFQDISSGHNQHVRRRWIALYRTSGAPRAGPALDGLLTIVAPVTKLR